MALTFTTLKKLSESNRELAQFLTDYQINEQILQKYQLLFEDYLISYELCSKQKKREKCQQLIPGYRYRLTYYNNQIKLVLTDCFHRINNLKKTQVIDNFLIRSYDEKLLSLSLSKDFIANNNSDRAKIVSYLKEYNYNLKTKKGLYLHGGTSVGKTYIMILIANKLIEKNNKICFITWPEFIIEIKKGFKNEGENLKKLEQVKNCDFLFIDDLGSEVVSAWSRDELLFPILNARVLPLKTTFINSSYDLNLLSHCYLLQHRNKIEELQVKRLIERIKKLTIAIELKPLNQATASQLKKIDVN